MVSTNTGVGGGTGSATTDIVGVRGTRSLNIGDTSLETDVGRHASDTVVYGGSNVTTRDTKYYRNRVSSDSIRYFQSIMEAVGIITNNDIENSELFSDSELVNLLKLLTGQVITLRDNAIIGRIVYRVM